MSAAPVTLTDDQNEALNKIESAYHGGGFFLLTGNAGTGKTTLLQLFTERMVARGRSIVLTAPTHKAVSVLSRKLADAGVEGVECRTIHSLLSLKPRPHGDRMVFERERRAPPVMADIVVIDECSMIDEQLHRHIRRHLPVSFVLFVGDPAQLPPVGEIASLTFATKTTAHLTTIVRQAVDNPIIQAADTIRRSQGGSADWSWCQQTTIDGKHGIFTPRQSAHAWMEKAFTSDTFEEDPDSFRYLAWTNARVAEINNMIRRWRYGERIPTPFMPGELAMFRAPVIIDNTVLFATNEEATVLRIDSDTANYTIPGTDNISGWDASFPVWRLMLLNRYGSQQEVLMPADERLFRKVIDQIKDEAADCRLRWKHLHDFKSMFAQLQSIYSMTVHNSQGSMIQNCFVDLPDIRKREATDCLEMQKLCYVATTRASQRLILIGA